MPEPSTTPDPVLAGAIAGMNSAEAVRFQRLTAERVKRRMEAVRLYNPQPEQDRFHRSLASERLVRGGNRSGKSLSCFMEVALAATGRDPHGKYPTDRPLDIWIICFEETNIGRTVYRMLFRAGAFYIIRDLESGQWRTFDPTNPSDRAREKQKKPAPPLIPPRFAPNDRFAWRKKKDRIFSSVRLTLGPGHPMNDTTIRVFASGSEPPQSDPVDLIHIDEDLKYPRHVPELRVRLLDRKGKMIWSAYPHTKNDALTDMHDRAEADRGMEHPDVEEFRLTMSGNPYLDEEEKRKVLKALSPEERLARDLGEFQFNRILMYPTFHIDTHGVPVLRSLGDPSNRDDYESEFDWVLRNKQVPTDWTRYMVVDPGNTLCAVLFAAVPPPQFGDYVLLYDELYIRNCDPTKFGIAVHGKAASYSFRAFIMDEHMGRSRHGRHNTLKQVYSHELKVRGIASETTGSWFIAGSDDVPGRCAIVRQWLNVRDSGPPKLRVLRGMCPNLEREFNRYKKEITKSIITDKPAKGEDDLMNCLEYLAAYGPAYYPPVPAAKPKNPALVFREEWLEEKRRRLGGDSVMLGPSSYN